MSNLCWSLDEPLSPAKELILLNDFDSKRSYYIHSPVTLDEVSLLLKTCTDKRERIELLLFYLRRQFSYDISIGRDEAKEALALSRSLNLDLHEAMSLSDMATAYSLYISSKEAHAYADSALEISKKTNDRVLESSIYYTKYVIDLLNEDHPSSASNLLKCVELAVEYASPLIRNERSMRLLKFALDWDNHSLALLISSQLEKEDLDKSNQVTFYILQGELKEYLGHSDSAKYYFQKAVDLSLDIETAYKLGLWYKNNNRLDSAIHYLTTSIEMMDPRQSYIGDRYLALAEIYEELDQQALAEYFLKKRLDESIRLVDRAEEARNYALLAQYYLNQSRLDFANEYALKSYELAKSYDFGSSIYESTLILSTLKEREGKFKEANLYLKEHYEQAQLNNEENISSKLKKAEIDSKIDYWIELSENKVQRAEQSKNFIIIVSVLLSIVLVLLLVMLKNKRKALIVQQKLNRQVVDQNKEIAVQRKKLQEMNESLSFTNEELEKKVSERTTELKEANQKLVNYSARLEEYANITAHNLRGPLVNIMGLANVYASSSYNQDENQTLISLINKSASEIDDVMKELNALLDVEHADQIAREKINLKQLISGLEEWIKEKAKSTHLDFKGYSTVDQMYSFKPYIERTLKELLINSYHYRDTEKKLAIDLSIEDKSGYTEIKVTDNGLGIDLDKYGNRIFNLNQRFHERNGRGVGLYLVKRQVEAMNGTISVNSNPGEGACFTLSLPSEAISA